MKHKRAAVLAVLALALGACICFSMMQKRQHVLTLSDFDFLKPSMSLEDIIARVGEPDRDVGSGFYMPEYDLVDGGVVGLQFGSDPDNLLMAVYESRDGTVTILVERQE